MKLFFFKKKQTKKHATTKKPKQTNKDTSENKKIPNTSNQTTLVLKSVSFEGSSVGIHFLSTESPEHAAWDSTRSIRKKQLASYTLML